jgi:hypothetical protein
MKRTYRFSLVRMFLPKCRSKGLLAENPAETLRLASLLVKAPNSRSRGHEFESPVRQELGALTKKWKVPWGQVLLQW